MLVNTVPTGTTIFIIDTEEYAGQFGAPLCAYLTGRLDNEFSAEKYAELYEQETESEPLEEVIDIEDVNGIMRPWALWPTPDWFCNDAGHSFRRGQESLALHDYKQTIKAEQQTLVTQKAIVIDEIKTQKTKNPKIEQLQKEIRHHKQIIHQAGREQAIQAFPAYLSVAIFFRPAPPRAIIDEMKIRALRFVPVFHDLDASKTLINITDFRVLSVETQLLRKRQKTA